MAEFQTGGKVPPLPSVSTEDLFKRIKDELEQDEKRRLRKAMDLPVVDGEIIGFRAWHSTPIGDLTATVAAAFWTPGDNTAVCRIRDFDLKGMVASQPCAEPPVPKCSCGLYARYDVSSISPALLDPDNYVCGIVQAWGRIELHSTGFRAEHMRIVALVALSNELNTSVNYAKLRKIADRYSVPVLIIEELQRVDAMTSEYGQFVPPELRPAAKISTEAVTMSAVSAAAYGLLVEMGKTLAEQKKLGESAHRTQQAQYDLQAALERSREKYKVRPAPGTSNHLLYAQPPMVIPSKVARGYRQPKIPRRERFRLW